MRQTISTICKALTNRLNTCLPVPGDTRVTAAGCGAVRKNAVKAAGAGGHVESAYMLTAAFVHVGTSRRGKAR
jgi:hypothetical protein